MFQRRRPHQRAGEAHEERRGHPLVGHVGDHQPQPPRGQLKEIVEIAAHLARRLPGESNLPAGQVRHLAGHEGLLQIVGQLQLPVQPFAPGPLLQQPVVLHSQSRLPGDPRDQLQPPVAEVI